jgi:hypothetical protein
MSVVSLRKHAELCLAAQVFENGAAAVPLTASTGHFAVLPDCFLADAIEDPRSR